MPTKDDTTKDPAAKAAAVSLLAKGLASKAEIAQLAGISRQLAGLWARDIPAKKARYAVLLKLWRKELKRKR